MSNTRGLLTVLYIFGVRCRDEQHGTCHTYGRGITGFEKSSYFLQQGIYTSLPTWIQTDRCGETHVRRQSTEAKKHQCKILSFICVCMCVCVCMVWLHVQALCGLCVGACSCLTHSQSRTWSKLEQTETDRQRRTPWARDGCRPVLALDACLSGRQIIGATADKMQTSSRIKVRLNAVTSLSGTETPALPYLQTDGVRSPPSHSFECHTSGRVCALFVQVCGVT